MFFIKITSNYKTRRNQRDFLFFKPEEKGLSNLSSSKQTSMVIAHKIYKILKLKIRKEDQLLFNLKHENNN